MLTKEPGTAMSKNPNAPLFESAMRGYDKNSVHTAVAARASEHAAAIARVKELELELSLLRVANGKSGRGAGYLALCRKLEGMLLTAAQEADVAEEGAHKFSSEQAASVHVDVEAQRLKDTQRIEMLVVEAKVASDKLTAVARADAYGILAEAKKAAEVKIIEAGELIEVARGEGVRLALEFENLLTEEREAFEKEVMARQEAADLDLLEAMKEMDKTKSETTVLPDDLRRAAQALIDASRAGAVEIVAQAKTRADFFRQEIERELVALTARRDANNAALSTTGGSLNALSGAAALTASNDLNDEPANGVAPTAEAAAAPADEVPVPAVAGSVPQPARGRGSRTSGAPVPRTDESTQGAQDKN